MPDRTRPIRKEICLNEQELSMDANEELRIQARNNSQEHFRFPINDAFMDVVIGRMAQNQQFCERVLDDAKFGDTVRDLLIGVVYDCLRRPTDAQL